MRRILWLIVLQLFAASGFAATRIDLNRDWAFVPPAPGAAAWPVDQFPEAAQRVDLPHTWNRSGRTYDLLGGVWYYQRFDLPKRAADSIAQLHFGAVFYSANVFVNGKNVGRHEGGYTGFSFDVAPQLRDGSNVIDVYAENKPGMYTIPGFGARGAPDAWYDWWSYGGITREVWLDIHGPVRIARQVIRSLVDIHGASITDRVTIDRRTAQPLTVRAALLSPAGQRLDTRLLAVPAQGNSVDVEFMVTRPQLWDLDHARFYRVELDVIDAAKSVLERATERFGIRTLHIDQRHLLLNGQRVRLTGMTRHSDSPWEGAAETRGTILHDWEDMKSLNMTLTRPVHYAPDPRVFDFADDHGILLIPEIPVWQASEQQLTNPQYLELAKQQMRETIEQYGNHPSVFAWSVMNESAAGTPGGIRFFRAMRDYMKSIDPARPVTLADDNLSKLKRADESAANDADFLMMNEYFGAWHGPREALGPALDKVNTLFPDKMVIISEMGYPGIFAKNPADADPTRVSILREQLPELAKRDWIAGAILWCYQDYKSRRYFWPGQEGGYLEHGIVDENRQRKPSYYAWKELNEPATARLSWVPSTGGAPQAFSVTITPNTAANLPSLPLTDYTLQWQLTGDESRAFASGSRPIAGAAPVTFGGAVPPRQKAGPFRLVVKLLRPDGSLAMERVLTSQ
jgi:beta-glucuronidase